MRWHFTLLLLAFVWAQQLVCGTDYLYDQAVAANPNLAKMRELLDQAIADYLTQNAPQLRTQAGCPESDFVIPVVVHIIHSGYGQSDSLPPSRVLTQMEQLFNDYRKRPYTKGYSSGIDTRIEFSLATKDPSGNPHPGITYTHYTNAGLNSPKVSISNGTATTMKNNVGWPRNKYLNIWVVGCIYSSDPSQCDILGFATFPGVFSATDQGVVVVSNYFGNSGGGQTATHETGHYLNLYHPFQGGCGGTTAGNCGSGGDRVCDTPPTRQANYGGARRQNTCTETTPATGGERPDQLRNYMEYLDDPSLDIFTEAQRARMAAALNTASDRQPLWQNANLQATGTGPYGRIKANFALKGCDQPPCYVCPGQSLELISYSMGQPNQFSWEIRQGATVIASSSQGPCATLSAPTTPGTYDVYLSVTNQAGSNDTTYTGFLIVRDPASARSLPLIEGFETSTFPPTGWVRQNPDFATGNSNLTWEGYISTGRGSFGASNGMARIRNFIYYNRTQRDQLITPLITIPASASNPGIEFDVYYRAIYWENTNANQYGYTYGDTLAVYISSDCGATWTQLYYKGGEDLDVTGSAIQVIGRNISTFDQAVPPTGPNTSWRHEVVSIPASFKGQTVLIRFENITEMGNHLYLDSIQIRENVATDAEAPTQAPITLQLAPNPATSHTYLHIKNAQASSLSWRLYDMQGHLVLSGEAQIPTADARLPITLEKLSSGLYLLQAQLGAETFLFRLIRE